MKPKVSVIIPNYNRALLIEDTLNSVLNQTHSSIEIIVVDDHSTDNSMDVLSSFVKAKSQANIEFKILLNDKKGAQSARNLGFSVSSGSYIQFLDSDDLLLPNKLNEEIAALEENKDLDLVYSKCQFFDENGLLNQFWGRELTGDFNDYFEFSWQTMCALYRRETVEKIGPWNESLNINQDWEYSIRAIILDLNIKFIGKVNSHIREHQSESIGKNLTKAKILGKELATDSILSLLLEKKLLTQTLQKRFKKRYLFIVFSLGAGKMYDDKNRILDNSFLFTRLEKILLKIKFYPAFKFILWMYGKMKRS